MTGIGVFESLRAYRGRIFRLEEHLKRFMESARTAGVADHMDLSKVRREVTQTLSAYVKKYKPRGDLFLRVSWWKENTVVLIGVRKQADSLYRQGVVLKTSSVKRSLTNALPSGAKTSAFQNAVMASLAPQPAFEWLLLDRCGCVTEVRTGNIFMVKNGELLTPPSHGILNGVTRRVVIECARQLGIPVKEIPMTRHEIFNADEVFLTNTSWEILPVRELDGRRTGLRIPGRFTVRLRKFFKKKVSQECR